MTQLSEKPKRTYSEYTEAQIERALVEVAACSGNTHMAARNLAEDDDAPPIPQQTLWTWSRRQFVDRYERIRQDALPVIQAQAADQHMALARQQMSLTAEAAALIAARMPQMDDKDLINAMGKADIGSGIHTEKAQLLSGLPTHRVERNADEIMRKLKSRGMVVDAEVVSEETVSSGSAVPSSVPALSSD